MTNLKKVSDSVNNMDLRDASASKNYAVKKDNADVCNFEAKWQKGNWCNNKNKLLALLGLNFCPSFPQNQNRSGDMTKTFLVPVIVWYQQQPIICHILFIWSNAFGIGQGIIHQALKPHTMPPRCNLDLK